MIMRPPAPSIFVQRAPGTFADLAILCMYSGLDTRAYNKAPNTIVPTISDINSEGVTMIID